MDQVNAATASTKTSPSGRRKAPASTLVGQLGGRFSVELGIRLETLAPDELFKWFVAALLFGAPIPRGIAARTYRELSDENLFSPRRLRRRGWNGLVRVLDRGGYARYDFKTATKLLEMSTALLNGYAGNLNKVHDAALNPVDLEQRLKRLAKGIGDVTAGIFLRELRGLWPKAQPQPSEIVMNAALDLRFIPRHPIERADALQLLKNVWVREGNRIKDFPDFEAALVRHGLTLHRRSVRRIASAPRVTAK